MEEYLLLGSALRRRRGLDPRPRDAWMRMYQAELPPEGAL
jgi:hypothetical protein